MIRKISCAVALMITTALTVNAQQTITFDSDNPGYKKKKKKEVKANSATIGIISAFNGFIPVYLERKVADFMSVQVGAGLTFRSISNDMGQILNEDGTNSEYTDAHSVIVGTTSIYDVEDSYESYKYRNARPGYCFSVAPRIYFGNNVMDGFFLAPEFSYKMYRYSAQLADGSVPIVGSYPSYGDDSEVPRSSKKMNEYMACMDYTLSIGGHYQRSNKMAVAWSLNAGVRRFQAQRLDVYLEYDSSTSTSILKNMGREYDGLRPLIMFNLAIGGCF
jgi:hypothetical protein